MSFQIPQMPLECNIDKMTYPNDVPTLPVPPYRVTVACQLTYGRRVQVSSTGGTAAPGVLTMCMCLLVPKGTDVRGPQSKSGADVVEVPAGTGRWYSVVAMDDVARGFPNEYRTALLYALAGVWPDPAP